MSYTIFKVAALFLVPLLAVLVPILIGQYYGTSWRKNLEDVKDAPIGTLVGAGLGLLGFMLAFTFQIATNRFDARKQLLLEECSVIRSTYLRAGLVPEPYRTATKKQLVEYVDLRANLIDYAKLDQAMERSQQILDSLWTYTESLAAIDRSSEVYALYTTSVNDMIDIYAKRVTTALQYRIPVLILWVLFFVNFLSMLAFGFHFGVTGQGSLKLNLLLAMIFAMVMFLILALDRQETGVAKINQQPMKDLQKEVHRKYLDHQGNKP